MHGDGTMNDFVTSKADTAPSHAAPRSPDSSARLELFLGTWRTSGRQYDCPFGRAGSIVMLETYQWLAGERYMIHRVDGRIDDDPLACIEIISNDSSRSACVVHSYYDDGRSNEWQLDEHAGAWRLQGSWRLRNESIAVRATIWFQNGGNTRATKWEYSQGGQPFQPFWEVTSSKTT